MRGMGTEVSVSHRRRRFRKRIFFILLSMVVIICAGAFYGTGSVDAHNSSENRYYKSIEVKKGDTLWEIAKTYMSDECDSIPAYVRELKELNGLKSDDIHEGSHLMVIYYDQTI